MRNYSFCLLPVDVVVTDLKKMRKSSATLIWRFLKQSHHCEFTKERILSPFLVELSCLMLLIVLLLFSFFPLQPSPSLCTPEIKTSDEKRVKTNLDESHWKIWKFLLKNFLELLLSSLSDLIQTNQNRQASSSLLSVFVFWFYWGEETLAKEKKAEYLIVETESRLQPRKLWTSSRRNKRLKKGFIWARKVVYNNNQKLQWS